VARLPSYDRYTEAQEVITDIKKTNAKKDLKEKIKAMLDVYIYDEVAYIGTDNYPNEATHTFPHEAKRFGDGGISFSKIPDIEFVDNPGGGGHWDYVVRSWDLAKLFAIGMLTEEEMKKWDERLWTEADVIIREEMCKKCLRGEANKDCPYPDKLMKRLVGECQGFPGETVEEQFDKLVEKAKEQEDKNES